MRLTSLGVERIFRRRVGEGFTVDSRRRLLIISKMMEFLTELLPRARACSPCCSVLNMKTAKTLGLVIPRAALVRTERVIE